MNQAGRTRYFPRSARRGEEKTVKTTYFQPSTVEGTPPHPYIESLRLSLLTNGDVFRTQIYTDSLNNKFTGNLKMLLKAKLTKLARNNAMKDKLNGVIMQLCIWATPSILWTSIVPVSLTKSAHGAIFLCFLFLKVNDSSRQREADWH